MRWERQETDIARRLHSGKESCTWGAARRIVPPGHMGLRHKTRFCNLGVPAPVRLDALDAHFVVADEPSQ